MKYRSCLGIFIETYFLASLHLLLRYFDIFARPLPKQFQATFLWTYGVPVPAPAKGSSLEQREYVTVVSSTMSTFLHWEFCVNISPLGSPTINCISVVTLKKQKNPLQNISQKNVYWEMLTQHFMVFSRMEKESSERDNGEDNSGKSIVGEIQGSCEYLTYEEAEVWMCMSCFSL